jgi:LIVCS family branched-chain amino acid:cation transporter
LIKRVDKKTLILGITLFAMFFGAGNLIFPPIMGYESRAVFLPSFIGFAITAIILPMLAINVIVERNGLKNLGNSIAPWFSSLLAFFIYLTIGPLLAIPRTSSTSFAIAIQPFMSPSVNIKLAMVVYSLVFFGLSVIIALRPANLTHILGKVTAPLLIILIFAVFFATIFTQTDVSSRLVSARYMGHPLITGFLDGYQTMDTIAALNFGVIFIFNAEAFGFTSYAEKKNITLKSSIIAGSFLLLIYLALGLIGKLSPAENMTNGAEILTYAVQTKFGLFGMIILAIIFVLACFNTCTALITCVSEYFHSILPKVSYRSWVFIFAFFSAIISIAGLNSIIKFSIPILSAIYPLSITLIIIGLFNLDAKENFLYARRCMMGLVGIFSILPVVFDLFGQADIFQIFPFYSVGLVWVIPMLIGLIVGYIAQKIRISD